MLIEVAFKGNRKEFFHWQQDEPPPLGASVIVDADRGEDLGRVHALGELAEKRCAGCAHGVAVATPDKQARRLATPDEAARAAELREQDEIARRRAAERVKANNLVMKISDAEWQWDRKKLTFYFTAERRVDFRTLVRELASAFRTRIELKQIGVRDEAKRLDGIGRCGRQYCSASWLPELRPVNLGVAKDQKLSLNPSQISGACGRLMCCLRYEHEFYVQSRKRFPKEGKILRTSLGEEKVVANDIFRDRVTLRGIEGDLRVVPLADLRAEMEAAASQPDQGVPPDASEPARRANEPARPAPDLARSANEPARPAPDPAIAVPLPGMAPAAMVVEDSGPDDAPGAADAARDRRPHRRRGRRGGRRGNGGSQDGSGAPNVDRPDSSAPDRD